MFRAGKLFHLNHVVNSLSAVDTWYDQVFSGLRFYRDLMRPAARSASLVAIGDLVMEPMKLATQVPGAENTPIGKFYARFGQHYHSVAWYVDSIEDTVDQFLKHNVRLYDLVGRPVKAPAQTTAIWTHPADTFTTMEFALIPKFTIDPRLHPGWSSAYWRDHHPLGIERASHITIAVKNIERAKLVFTQILGGEPIHEEQMPGRKHSVFFAIGEDTVIEATQPLSEQSPEAGDIARYGEGIFSLTFQTKDSKRAAEHLRAKNQRVESEGADSLAINRDDSFGIGIGFTQRSIPNDPRR